jgi:hypothetical protein
MYACKKHIKTSNVVIDAIEKKIKKPNINDTIIGVFNLIIKIKEDKTFVKICPAVILANGRTGKLTIRKKYDIFSIGSKSCINNKGTVYIKKYSVI